MLENIYASYIMVHEHVNGEQTYISSLEFIETSYVT